MIANAGISIGIDSADRDDLEVMRAIVETNILGMAATFQPFIAAMCSAAAAGWSASPASPASAAFRAMRAYCASKAGAIAYCESLRGECRPLGVDVVTFVPGYIDTPLTAGNRYAMPFRWRPTTSPRRLPRHRRGRSYRVIPWQMGIVAAAARCRTRCSTACSPAGRAAAHE